VQAFVQYFVSHCTKKHTPNVFSIAPKVFPPSKLQEAIAVVV
jgi:hypothetical protein